jgi:nucleoside-diphosphate-sugar epimerase
MHILIIGAAGMIGRRLTAALLAAGHVGGREITQLTLADVVAPALPATTIPATATACDLSAPGAATALIATRPDLIFHLAAIVSGEAEADFDKGYRINLGGTQALLEAIRAESAPAPYCPRVIFTSSIAVFGAPFPEVIGDDFLTAPLTSYGTQKAIGELLLNDCTRRGFIDGVGIRLPTVVIRPGAPNRAASGFFSGILREPLLGMEAVLPVPRDTRHWFCSPDAAVGFLTRAAAMETAALGTRRSLSVPGLSATVADEIAALERIAGPKATRLIRAEPDATIARIVAGWPQNFTATRALSLGFRGDASFDAIIRQHVEAELGGRIA